MTAGSERAAPLPLLRVSDLAVSFSTDTGVARAVDGVSFAVHAAEAVALVGESGCGKTATALSVLGLLPRTASVRRGSSIRFRGEELLEVEAARLRQIRGGEIGMIFQESMTSLNPVLTVGEQIAEGVRAHRTGNGEGVERVEELLQQAGVSDPQRVRRSYPHELSGGLRQRSMIAMALAGRPSLLIADEPTTALDVTVQGRILELLQALRSERGLALLLITHDLAVAARAAERIIVMYAGQIVEQAAREELFTRPLHPYAQGLLAAVPRMEAEPGFLEAIPGAVPSAGKWPIGCRFHPRCPRAWDRCEASAPPLYGAAPGRTVRCWLAEEEGA